MTADPRTAEVQMANPAVLGLANPFRPLLAAQASPEQHCQWLHDLLPLDDYRAAPEGWLAHTVAQQLPDLLICASIASGFSLRWADQDGVPVLLVYGGTLQVAQAEARWCLGPGEVLVLNGATTEISSAGVSAVLLICSRRRLLAAACELVGRPRPARAWVERLGGAPGPLAAVQSRWRWLL